MTWFDHIKAYVWNDVTTPYLFPVVRLRAQQREKELYTYSVGIMVLFGVVALGAFSHWSRHGEMLSLVTGVHGITIFFAGLLVGWRHHPLPAQYLLTGPAIAFFLVLSEGMNIRLGGWEKIGMLVFIAAWGWYGLRVVKITMTPPYEGPEEPKPPGPPPLEDRLLARLEADYPTLPADQAAPAEKDDPPR